MHSPLFRFVTLILFPLIFSGSLPAQTPEKESAQENKVKVTLLEAGTAPRRELRFKPAVGKKQTADMIINMEQKLSLGGNNLPGQKIPAQKMTIVVEVTDVAENGDISFEYVYEDMKVMDDENNPSPIAETLQSLIEPMIGTTGSGVISDRGITRRGEVNIPDDLNPQMKQMLEGMKDSLNQLSSPVPAEPIGVGAKWQVVQDHIANGLKVTQTSTHQITRLDADGFEMSVEVTQKADPQTVENPMLPPGTKLTLNSLDSGGDGMTKINESLPFPISSEVAIHTVADMSIDIAGQKQKMTTDITMKMSISPVKE